MCPLFTLDGGDFRGLTPIIPATPDRPIWLNPLIGTTDFAPLTEGLQAALPFVDDFLPVRTLRDVRDLTAHLNEGSRA